MLSQKEIRDLRRYNLMKGLHEAANRGNLTGIEAEMHQEGLREAQKAGIELRNLGSLILPSFMVFGQRSFIPKAERRAITVGGNGASLVGEDVLPPFTQAFDRLALAELGATFLTGLVGDTILPKLSRPTSSWRGETADGSVTDNSPEFSKSTLTPHRLTTYIPVSLQLFFQVGFDVGAWLFALLTEAIAVDIQQAAIKGTGTNDQPKGILNIDGLEVVSGGDNGAAPSWDNIQKLEKLCDPGHSDLRTLGYLTNTLVRSTLKVTEVSSGTGLYCWKQDSDKLNGHPALVTDSVPSDLTKGTGTDLSAIIFGNWKDLVIGNWGGIEIVPDKFTQKKSAIVQIFVNSYWDVALARVAAFTAMKDLITA